MLHRHRIDPSTSSRDIDFYSKNFNQKLEHKISKSVALTARSGWRSIKLQTNIKTNNRQIINKVHPHVREIQTSQNFNQKL